MIEPVKADTVLHQYMVLALNGEPTMGKGATALDGKRVRHLSGTQGWPPLDGPEYNGVVLGPSLDSDFAWVRWEPEGATPHFGLHRLTDLKEVDD